jgi:hypothetical protein
VRTVRADRDGVHMRHEGCVSQSVTGAKAGEPLFLWSKFE